MGMMPGFVPIIFGIVWFIIMIVLVAVYVLFFIIAWRFMRAHESIATTLKLIAYSIKPKEIEPLSPGDHARLDG